MLKRIYTPRHVLSDVIHYSAAAAIGAGAFYIGAWWMLAAAAGLTGVSTYASLKANKEFFENNLQEHPDAHKHSPRLRTIVEELFKRSGLRTDKYKVYDFAINENAKKKQSAVVELFKYALKKMSDTPNAVALNLGKPVIAISQPLLQLLTDEEEHGVLAHEFAHAAARHQHLMIPQKLFGTFARISNTLSVLTAAFAQGVWNFAKGVLVQSGVAAVCNMALPKTRKAKEDDLSLRELKQKKTVAKITGFFTAAAGVAFFSYTVPGYLPLWGSAKGMAIASKLLEASFSRSIEYQADRGAVVLGANPLALITALRKLTALLERSKQHAWGEGEMPKPGALTRLWKQANSTHPTLNQRVGRLAGMAEQQGYSAEEIEQAVNGPIDISHAPDVPYETIKAIAARFY